MSSPLKDLKLSSEELKEIVTLFAKTRDIKDYKSMPEDRLISALKESESLKESEKNFDDKKPKRNFSKARIEKIRKEFNESRHKFSKSKINEIRKNLYEIENEKNLFASKIKEIERSLTELEQNIFKTEDLSNPKSYYDYDDTKYEGVKDINDLFDLSLDEDYYKPIVTKGTFNNNYIQNESNGGKVKSLSIEKYLNMITPYLCDIINNHKTHGLVRYHSCIKTWLEKTPSEWKIQLTVQVNFISSKGSDETRIMLTKSNNVEIMIGSEKNEIIKELFKSLLQRYQEGLEESMKGSDFTFDSVDALYYDLNKISLSRGGSYIDSPEWLKNKKTTINPKNNDDKCFQNALTVALNYQKIESNPERIPKIKPFIDQYN